MSSADYLTRGNKPGNRIMKVDHAGERGAICIYSGQLFMARLFVPVMVDERKEFLAHDHPAAQIDVGEPCLKVLTPIVTAWTQAVIWMGMRS